jgi:protease stability complex PrcB-like protein
VLTRPHPGLALTLVTAAVTFAVLWPLYVHAVRHGGSRPYPWRDATRQIGPLPLPRPAGRLFESKRNLARYLAALTPERKVPRITLASREALLVAAGPRSSTGYDVRVLSVVKQRSRILIRVREVTPLLGQRVRPAVTSPYRLITFPATDKPVAVDWQER